MRGIDLFCSAGGSTLGAKMAGHEVIAAYDINSDAKLDGFEDGLQPEVCRHLHCPMVQGKHHCATLAKLLAFLNMHYPGNEEFDVLSWTPIPLLKFGKTKAVLGGL